ncbi:MAG: redox-sensing transcriptional repressor Rex [Ruminococcaceae bacterium]|nr:redox-sensing transcriptional repressor Rex [Oscillospiraceae bacterium]
MAHERKDVPLIVIRRLPRYYRYLSDLKKQGITRISSSALSKKMGVTASQIRQDFNYFGEFGQQGYGYNVEHLRDEIADILGLKNGYKTIIIGAGNLGHALANHTNFKKRGFSLIGIFDKNPDIIGKTIAEIEVMDIKDLESFMKSEKPDIAILSLPKSAVREVAIEVCRLGIKGIWNFSYWDPDIFIDVPLENVHLSDSLMTLSYNISKKEEQSDK